MQYGEGIYVGYRHFERAKIAPLFPFGHGLSYTAFEYGKLSLSSRSLASPAAAITMIMAVSNVGKVPGAEVVQVYVADEKSRLPRPAKELVAFEKVFLEPGETRHISVSLDRFAVGYYDPAVSAWIAEQGSFKVLVGASSADIRYVTLVVSFGREGAWLTSRSPQTNCYFLSQRILYLGGLDGPSQTHFLLMGRHFSACNRDGGIFGWS